MFYDAHYLYPRPWTQAQEAPGVPEPFPVAFYGDNTISQTFISGADKLSMVEVWLQGSPYGSVDVTLADESGPLYSGQIDFSENPRGGVARFSFPMIDDAEERPFQLILSSSTATAAEPAITHVIGGDRLGGVLRVNEFLRPGNLELRTFVRGTAVFDALTEQLLPDLFRLRLAQFKPAPFKGEWFAILLVLSVGLTGVFLVLARPPGATLKSAIGWSLASLLALFLVWQIGSGRVQLPLFSQKMATAVAVPSPANELRVVDDLSATLWTADRQPEERFVTTAIQGDYPAIVVPASSALEYTLDLPRNGRLRTGVQIDGEGALTFGVSFNGDVVTRTIVTAADDIIWLDLDLTPWQGQGGVLRLTTEPTTGEANGLWLMPQLLAQTDWLLAELPPLAESTQYRFGNDVTLVGYSVQPSQPQSGDLVTVTLYWQGERPLTQNATVFVHALTENYEMVAQSDSQPVQNSYPLSHWPPGVIIADAHTFNWPTDANLAHIAVGLYDSTTLTRWPVTTPDNSSAPDSQQALLPVETLP